MRFSFAWLSMISMLGALLLALVLFGSGSNVHRISHESGKRSDDFVPEQKPSISPIAALGLNLNSQNKPYVSPGKICACLPFGKNVRFSLQHYLRELHITDLCLFTDARCMRHPSQADRHAPFQDFPGALDLYPSGSFMPYPLGTKGSTDGSD